MLTTPTVPSEHTIQAVSSTYQEAADQLPDATPPSPSTVMPPPPPPSPTLRVTRGADAEPPDNEGVSLGHPTAGGTQAVWRPEVRLPSAHFGFDDTGRAIFMAFGKRKSMFIQHRTVVELNFNTTKGSYDLVPVTSSAFRSRLEDLGQVVAYRSDNKGRWSWRPTLCSEDNAKGLLATRAAQEHLPRISTVVSCPVLVPGADGKLKVLNKGYHPEQGGIFVTKGEKVPEVSIKEAGDALWDLLADFKFVTDSDASRAMASFLTPALALGGLLGAARIPMDLALASASQSGKTYRQRLVAAIYGETPYVVAQKEKGVGGLMESLGQGLLSGRPFVQIDNLRGSPDTQYLEAFMTAEHIGVRIPHRAEALVNTSRFIIMATSNDLGITQDLLNRSSIIRIKKRPANFKFKKYAEGDLLDHVKANQPFYLGCIFAVLREWWLQGRPRSDENAHDFRVWCQSCDHMVQHVIGNFVPLLEGYEPTPQVIEGVKPLQEEGDAILVAGLPTLN